MTYLNCSKYRDEAKDEATRVFWEERIKRKYHNQVIVKEKKVAEKPSKSKKKAVKE